MYIVSDKHKIAFKRIFKNAHSSIIKWLKSNDDNLEQKENVPNDYFKFAIIRDPVSRFMSGFIDKFLNKYIRNDYKKEYSANIFLKQNKISMNIEDISLIYLLNNMKRTALFDCDEHFRIQSTFLNDGINIYNIKFLDRDINELAKQKGMLPFTTNHYDNRKEYKYIDDKMLYRRSVKNIAFKYDCLPSKDSFLNIEIVKLINNLYKEDRKLYDSFLHNTNR